MLFVLCFVWCVQTAVGSFIYRLGGPGHLRSRALSWRPRPERTTVCFVTWTHVPPAAHRPAGDTSTRCMPCCLIFLPRLHYASCSCSHQVLRTLVNYLFLAWFNLPWPEGNRRRTFRPALRVVQFNMSEDYEQISARFSLRIDHLWLPFRDFDDTYSIIDHACVDWPWSLPSWS